jgi:glycosyltransferase involved in cell wall biosynthesis
METIAVCLTTHNRKEVFEETLSEWEKYLPSNATIFVVDDASQTSVKSNYRFEQNVGIAKAKNKCLELAEKHDHIFLCDDDVRPKTHDWFKPYMNSGANHLCLTFDKKSNNIIYSPSIRFSGEYKGLMTYTAPNGCMLYLKNICLQVAGGMRPEFGLWGFEHVEYSQRIHDLGLTPKPFIDVKNSLDLFDVLDWRFAVNSSLSIDERRKSGKLNLKVWEQFGGKPEFVSYK